MTDKEQTATLSDKKKRVVAEDGQFYYVFNYCDVKEFIKQLKEKVDIPEGIVFSKWVIQEIDKLAGDKLI